MFLYLLPDILKRMLIHSTLFENCFLVNCFLAKQLKRQLIIQFISNQTSQNVKYLELSPCISCQLFGLSMHLKGNNNEA